MKMTKRELINRWKSKEGQLKLERMLNALREGNPLSSISKLERYKGRWDVRGAELSMLKAEKKIGVDGRLLTQKIGTLRIGNADLDSIDFSYCSLNYSFLEKCRISNCIFFDTQARELRVLASHISNCIFEKVNLFNSYVNENIGRDSGLINSVEFIESNLSQCIFFFPGIQDCSFINCNLKETDFDGSRLTNCRFKGTLDSVWFRGYSKNAHRSVFGIFNRVDPRDYPNVMRNIDFTDARLVGVAFRNNIDLSTCKFPSSADYILVHDLKEAYERAKQFIVDEWDGEDKRVGIHMINNVYYTKDSCDQRNDLIDKFILVEQFGEKFAGKFFDVLRRSILES